MTGPLLNAAVVAQASDVGDPSATRTVYITIGALAVLGVLFVVLAFWLLRQTRPDLELLAPLEEMDRRAWRNQDPATRRRLLDENRPPGAEPLQLSDAEPTVDTTFAEVRPPMTFSDLADGAGPITPRLPESPNGVPGSDDVSEKADPDIDPDIEVVAGQDIDDDDGDVTGDIDVGPESAFAPPVPVTAATEESPDAPGELNEPDELNELDELDDSSETVELDRPAAAAVEAAALEAAQASEQALSDGDAVDAR